MKNFLPVFILFVVFGISCGDDSTSTKTDQTNSITSSNSPKIEPGSPEEFANILAGFVIDSNYQGIVGLIIQKDEMTELIAGSSVTPEGKKAAIEHVETEIGKMKIDMSNGLIEIRKSGITSGIVWSNSTYKDARYTINNPTGYDMMQLHCVIDCNGIEHVFTVTDVVHTKNGWKLGGKMMFGDVSR